VGTPARLLDFLDRYRRSGSGSEPVNEPATAHVEKVSSVADDVTEDTVSQVLGSPAEPVNMLSALPPVTSVASAAATATASASAVVDVSVNVPKADPVLQVSPHEHFTGIALREFLRGKGPNVSDAELTNIVRGALRVGDAVESAYAADEEAAYVREAILESLVDSLSSAVL
jgi:hypothetical protein